MNICIYKNENKNWVNFDEQSKVQKRQISKTIFSIQSRRFGDLFSLSSGF